MHKFTEKELPATATEADITTSVVSWSRTRNSFFVRNECQGIADTRIPCFKPENLEEKGQQTGSLNPFTRPETVRHGPPALQPVYMESEHTRDRGTDKPVETTQKSSILFPAVVPRSADEGRNASATTVTLAELLSFPTVDTDVTFMASHILQS